jgi:hypothetical protein
VARADESEHPAAVGPADQARLSFRRGVELYDEHDLDGAEVEFRHAYGLAKNFRILYNLGQVARERHDYAAAVDFYYRYLRDGGLQIPTDRAQALEDELAKLRQRVGRLNIVYAGLEADVRIDDVKVGRTPLSAPLTVNLGRRHVSLKPRQGTPQVRIVDVAAGETVTLNLAQTENAAASGPPEAEVDVSSPPDLARAEPGIARSRGALLAWTFTAVAAAGAAVAGVIAYGASNDLKDMRKSYPVSQEQLDNKQHHARVAGWVTDSLLASTAVLAAVSLYLTFDRPGENKPVPRISVGLAWPGIVQLRSGF